MNIVFQKFLRQVLSHSIHAFLIASVVSILALTSCSASNGAETLLPVVTNNSMMSMKFGQKFIDQIHLVIACDESMGQAEQ